MSEPVVKVEIDGDIGSLVLARAPARNAMSVEMGRQVTAAVESLGSSSVRAVVVAGEGAVFSAGGDFDFLLERLKSTPAENHAAMRRFYDAFLSVRRLKVPTIAAVQGAAIGAGLCFAMGCDLRIAAEGTKLAVNFVKLGLHPGMGATWLLPRLVGPARAAELLMTGRQIDAAEALRIGLVNEVVPAGELLARAKAVARELASAGPVAVAQVKASLGKQVEGELEAALELEAAAQAVSYATKDLAEGVAAARERRAPKFTGA
ncbi:MAG: enoyl-CoA hydratase/isomerase family protein [Myxococcaceae bacterium]|nr:enoyl-CoA hydratase/isomerase family protein [Myxococcaceae bacterium]